MSLYESVLRPSLFVVPPALAHRLAVAALAVVERTPPLRALTAQLHPIPELPVIEAMGLSFRSPLGLAGGFDKDGHMPRTLAALGFGFVELGTVTAQPQTANPAPNLFRLPADRALINRLGFPNHGAKVIAARLRRLRPTHGWPVPTGVSIGKSRSVKAHELGPVIEDYLVSFRAIRDVADFVVVNISSPNTAGLRAMQAPTLARALLGTLLQENTRGSTPPRPLLVKLAPDLKDEELAALLQVIRELQLDGVVATNTTVARQNLSTDAATVARLGEGGLSGPPLRRRALEVVRQARAGLGPRATIIGVGGIEEAQHVVAYLNAGATLVQAYTAFIYQGPGFASRLAQDLEAHLGERGARRRT